MAAGNESDYKQEVRFAVVMYGGVSLAIYINGVAQELLRLVRSTAEHGKPLTGTERIYRKVSFYLASEQDGIEQADADDATSPPPTRFTVDIISGTSAGGINGIFLAKALANGQDMERLKELWVEEGDIETLINDKRSIEKPLKLQDPPTSLLNSERMYFELLKAFDLMDVNTPARTEKAESPLVDELDLFVTSTDLQGVVLPISLSDSLVYEKRHRNVMHFVYSKETVSGESTRNDFHGKFNPFLAYAARCTSSFPFAFEPMALSDIDRLLGKLPQYRGIQTFKADSPDWERFYHDYRDPRGVSTVPFYERPFGDGGYLDNKPFTYATETLMNRTASVPVDRKLIYVEPSPEHPEDDVEAEGKPDAIDNVLSALLTLPRYETIREDLERVNDRNRLIDRVNSVTSGVDRDEDIVRNTSKDFYTDDADRWKNLGALVTPDVPGQLWSAERLSDKEQSQLDLMDVIKRKGRAYAAYHRLRISAVTDELAQLITRVAGFDETSEYSIIIRSMVRAWRVGKYIEYRTSENKEQPTANQFLYEFDLAYPIRRINYLRRKVDALYRFEEEAMTVLNIQARKFDMNFENLNADSQLREAFRNQVLKYKADLNGLFVTLRYSARSLRSRKSAEKAAIEISPLSSQVATLIAEITQEVKKLSPNSNSNSLIIDYFLGRREEAKQRSYRADSPQDQCIKRSEAFLTANSHIRTMFDALGTSISNQVVEVKTKNEEKIDDLFTATCTHPLDPDPQLDKVKWIARYCVGHYYEHYEDYDLLTYPILYDTDVGEADTIDVIRVSPEDATQLINERKTGCHKLAGTALGHFGAFLQQSWRQNDILWGRLDGAERIISALLPFHPLKEQLIGEAHAEIICETIGPMGEEEAQTLLAESLMRTRTRKAEPELLDKFIANLREHSKADPVLEQKLNSLISAPKLREFYVRSFPTRSKVDPENTLRSIARATNVIGKILEALSAKRKVDTKYALWIARLGQVFWALVEVAVPQSFANLFFRHWLKLVYFMEVLLIAGGTLLAQPQMQQFGVTAFGITAGIHLAVMILGDLITSRNRWINVIKAMVIVAVVGLVVLGVFTLSAMLGIESSWNVLVEARRWITEPAPFGFNTRTLFRFGLLAVVVLMFLGAIRGDVRALFKKQGGQLRRNA